MLIKWRWLWMRWGPDMAQARGWEFGALLFPRPNETPKGEMVRGAVHLEVRRDGPSIFGRNHETIHSDGWTGLKYDWPPRFSLSS